MTCSIWNSLEPDTWLHVLQNCKQRHIHVLQTKKHNKALWALRKLLPSSQHSRCYIRMNAGTFNENPSENIVPPWLLPCTCDLQRCHCNARCKPDILCVSGLPYQANSPTTPENNLKIQLIEFTYCNDRFSSEAITRKTEKYQPLLDNISNRGWNVEPLIVITAGARATTQSPSIKILDEKLKIRKRTEKKIVIDINTIAIQHAMSIILHKRRVENNEPLPVDRKSNLKCKKNF